MIRTLISIFRKNTENYLPQRKVYRVLLVLITLLILIPCALVVGFMSFLMTEALNETGNPGGGVLFEIQILSAFSMVFGSWVVFNLLFFTSDREHLVHLPIPSRTLLMARFLYAYLAESAMEFFMLIAVFAGYYLAMADIGRPLNDPSGTGGFFLPVSLAGVLAGTVFIPLIPMIYAALYSMLLMALLKNVKSRDTFSHMTTVLMLVFIGGFLCSLKGMGEINMDNYVQMLGSGQDVFLRTLNLVFFAVPWLTDAVCRGSAVHLFLFLISNAVLLGLLYFCGGSLYREGLYKAGALGTSRRAGVRSSDYRCRSPFATSLLRELRVLIRTKAFANNCVYVNLILPVSAFALFYFMRDKGSLRDFIILYRAGKDRAALLLTVVILALAFLATALNTIASTSFTREGAHLALVRYIPVPANTQILAKAAASFIITCPVLFLTDGIICYFMGTGAKLFAYYLIMTFLACLIALVTGMVLDSMAPYLTWEDEYSALRGNINSFFSMGAMMLCCLLTVGISFLFYEGLHAPIGMYYSFLFFLLLAVAVSFSVIGLFIHVRRNIWDL